MNLSCGQFGHMAFFIFMRVYAMFYAEMLCLAILVFMVSDAAPAVNRDASTAWNGPNNFPYCSDSWHGQNDPFALHSNWWCSGTSWTYNLRNRLPWKTYGTFLWCSQDFVLSGSHKAMLLQLSINLKKGTKSGCIACFAHIVHCRKTFYQLTINLNQAQ